MNDGGAHRLILLCAFDQPAHAVVLIETVRGVPFIAILYTATLLFPLMLPAGAVCATWSAAAWATACLSSS